MSGLAAIARALAGLFFVQEPVAAAPAGAPSASSLRADRRRYARECMILGLEACRRSDQRRAFDTFHEAFVAFQAIGDRKAASLMQKTIGLVAEKVEAPAKVRATFTSARGLLQQAGLHDEEARTLFLLADFEARHAAYTTAYPLYEESLRLSRSIGYVGGEVECLCRYGWTLKLDSQDDEAKRRILEARKTAQEHGTEALVARVKRWMQKFMAHDAAQKAAAKAAAIKPAIPSAAGAQRPWQPIQDGKPAAPPGSIAAVQPRQRAAPAAPTSSVRSSLKKRASGRR